MIAVIGGGASGMTAAITAARSGASVMLFEKEERLGRKILATGNGRCNVTNLNISGAAARKAYRGSASRLTRPVFARFGLHETTAFFASMGIVLRDEGDDTGRLYPFNFQASSVQDALRYELRRLHVDLHASETVRALVPEDENGYTVQSDWKSYHASSVILAGGGQSSPKLGSDGSCFRIAEALGLKVIQPLPSLVKLKSDFPFTKHLDGLRIPAKVSLYEDQTWLRSETEDLLFTSDGISGPGVMQLSSMAVRSLARGRRVDLEADLYPDIEEKELSNIFEQTLQRVSYKPVTDALNGLVHKKMIPVVLSLCGINHRQTAAKLSGKEIESLVCTLKHLRLHVTGDGGFEHSQVTIGGVAGYEVTDQLESRIYPGLYFAGEVLDIDGDCGGFNLQWAWSSGHVAGVEAASCE